MVCLLALEYLMIMEEGPKYGYYLEPAKTHVVCTEAEEPKGQWAFLD